MSRGESSEGKIGNIERLRAVAIVAVLLFLGQMPSVFPGYSPGD
jgi:hypothetical protein